MRNLTIFLLTVIFSIFFVNPELGFGQGITTANLSGTITDSEGNPLSGANVVATHEPTGIQYGAAVRDGGQYDILSMRIGGPYTIRVTFIGYGEQSESDVYLQLGQTSNVDFQLTQEAIQGAGVLVTAEMHDVLNSGRTGAASYISSDQVEQMPSVNRSIRDLIRLDPRSDGNYSFGGRNWLYNNISLDGSYFNNPFGLDDPAPGGQSGAEPVSFDAIEQVQVSIAPFDVREGGFTGAGINTVTKSGTNQFHGSVYDYTRNQSMIGNSVGDVDKVIEDPNLKFNQVGFTFSGPIIQNKLFFFVNAEVERRTDPGTNYSASSGAAGAGESRVDAATMQAIRDRMLAVYGYDTGPFQGYDQKTDNNKALLKLDWNVSSNHNATFRVNILDARRDLGPHPFVLSFNSTGRGPNTSSLPFQNSGYQINNDLQSYAFELNSTFGGRAANRFFFSYNRFRDFRDPLSADFPTIDIGQDGVTYTTLGHEPFSIHNILDQNVLQITDNYSYFSGNHIYTVGASYEKFSFFNSFNIFRHGVFFLPDFLDFIGGATFSSVDDFLRRTGADPDSADFIDFNAMIGSGPFKGEQIDVAQFSVYAQDEYQMSEKLKLTYGLRVDIPVYLTEPEANPFSTGLTLLDENDKTEVVDQAKLPGSNPLYSPRIGFNYDVNNDRSLQLRGGTGVFTGRVPFVWIGNVISNPGNNPNLYSPAGGDVTATENITDDGSARSKSAVFLKSLSSSRKYGYGLSIMEGYERFMLPIDDDTYVVYPRLDPVGSSTLRWTSRDPNEHGVSKATRGVFGPATGRCWASLDYSNLDLRIAAYDAGESEMIELFEKPDKGPYFGSYHLLVFDILHPDEFREHGVKCKEVYGDTLYKWTKAGNFAIQYGAMEGNGTADAAYHVEGAQALIAGRFEKISQLNQRQVDIANDRGYVETIPDKELGTAIGYPVRVVRGSSGKVKETQPLNYRVSSTAMWVFCRAMVEVHDYLDGLDGWRMIAMVKDEIIL
ncbi:MAG: TonB-dependent receptor, partial [Candidatus Marinimicrobia bacterium]|nr:TonB-dependent receptor [Candidatus Neomarinimicrobiota bacterium]